VCVGRGISPSPGGSSTSRQLNLMKVGLELVRILLNSFLIVSLYLFDLELVAVLGAWAAKRRDYQQNQIGLDIVFPTVRSRPANLRAEAITKDRRPHNVRQIAVGDLRGLPGKAFVPFNNFI